MDRVWTPGSMVLLAVHAEDALFGPLRLGRVLGWVSAFDVEVQIKDGPYGGDVVRRPADSLIDPDDEDDDPPVYDDFDEDDEEEDEVWDEWGDDDDGESDWDEWDDDDDDEDLL